MTREQALKINQLLFKIESLESLHDELLNLESLNELGDIDLKKEILHIITNKLDKALKELEEL